MNNKTVSLSGDKYYSDEELVDMYRHGSERACEELITRYAGIINTRSSNVITAGGDVDDVKQEAYMGLLSAIRTYVPTKQISFSVYAKICISNTIKNVLQKYKTQKSKKYFDSVSIEEVDENLFNNKNYTPEMCLINKESYNTLVEKIGEELSSFERDVLFSYLSGLSYEESAKKLNSNEKSVDNALQRARKKLKAVLREIK